MTLRLQGKSLLFNLRASLMGNGLTYLSRTTLLALSREPISCTGLHSKRGLAAIRIRILSNTQYYASMSTSSACQPQCSSAILSSVGFPSFCSEGR